ncbi:MAG: hopanoid biosynthesis associated glycosyl transferase protein HpnI [Candidatus Accumulibacter appositus]|uniref:Hopanoid biosynthesis associated glycosyl transferase protein HpnI n=1 Tax=Candidatus Accumulibacter appositus TaxID=1454003 RepID=A0A011P2F1_9PROT|nr:glycosyltransferase [Accumulibacter sp.]EXI81796.1 MAG: hopanoid biosynthesis associated glycosyl transferase protein HpnI [Candidatus Accumulibacter appositus]HRF04172.1 glycosyltransferase [Accumulibacter sp.]
MSLTLIVLCVPAFLVAAAGLLAGLVFMSALSMPRVQRSGTVTMILPLTGEAVGLAALLRALEVQTLPARRLLICVEGRHDPAYARALQLASTTSLPIEILIAGEASDCAQKCCNQIAGLARIDARDEVVVLFDADIAPPPWWLSALATPLLDGSADIVTGYRWPLFAGQRFGAMPGVLLSSQLAAAIDRGIALLPRLAAFPVTWGGSLALSPRALEKLDAARLLGSTLSDDCSLGAQAAALGLRVLTRRALLVPTPASGGLVALWRFGRRQYQIIRVYRPSLWWLALLALSSRVTAWGVLMANFEQGWARLATLALLIFALLAVLIQALVGRRLGMADPLAMTVLQGLLALCKPLLDVFHWSLVLAAVDTRIIRWGHLAYRVAGPAQIAVMSRRRWG